MKLLILVSLSVASVLGHEYNSEADTKLRCTPGETFKKDCNTCRCSDDGKLAACTLMACPPKPDPVTEPSNEVTTTVKQVCEPGSTFKIKCNTCACSSDGTSAACTRMACPGWEEGGELRCEPGTTFKRDCNTCRCSKDGKSAACTLMACLPKPNPVTKPINEVTTTVKQVCEPGSTFKIKCNTCACSSDGTSAACTRMACPEWGEENQLCEPGESFKEDCNSCVCGKDGKTAACTLKACLNSSLDSRSNDEFSCKPNESFKLKCNDCKCSADGKSARCTLKQCSKNM